MMCEVEPADQVLAGKNLWHDGVGLPQHLHVARFTEQ